MIGLRRGTIRVETLKRSVRCLQAAIVLATAAILVTLLRPVPSWQPPSLDVAGSQPSVPLETTKPLDLAEIWKRDLRQPPVDPPAAALPPLTPEAPLSIKLVGTAVEPDRRFAVFALQDNSLSVREIGATVGGYELVAVERGSATVRRNGRDHLLRVPWFDRIAADIATGRGSP